ncbi:MAG: hypothetical protein ACRENJ_09210 [Candidatus Eiseniibacteriota bacterium]
MMLRAIRLVAHSVLMFLAGVAPAFAGARTVIGDSWSTPSDKLQSIVDATYGPGRIDVRNDYLGAQPGGPDRIVWSRVSWPVMKVREIAGTALRTDLGWYIETGDGQTPLIDGVDDGPVFRHGQADPSTSVLLFWNRGREVGFYLRSADAGSGQGPRTFFTNRSLNDVGPGGGGAVQEPFSGGDIQALIFDVSPWTRPLTWLVCFETRDSGAQPGACCATTDNDFADYVFEVRADATTPARAPSFGTLKSLYRD